MSRIRHIGEDEIISAIARNFPTNDDRVLKSIGDDTAATLQKEDFALLSTTDILMEGVHFNLSYSSPYILGRKSVNISTSDIAAMGGTAKFLLMSIALPKETTMDFINELYKGIKSACDESDVVLIGGNTSLSKDSVVINSTVLGEAPKDKVIYRSGAKPGDKIFVTGTMGDSALGLKLLAKGIQKGRPVEKHLNPTARLTEGKLLGEKALASAMADLSDGIVSDLNHICNESKVGAEIFYDKLPLSDEMDKHLKDSPSDKELPLSGGEDYELIFTVPEDKLSTLESLRSSFTATLTEIGTITDKENGIKFLDNNSKEITVKTKGFKHF